MLYRTFAELDLRELNGVMEALDARNKVSGFDPEAILGSYEGHTILSIFFDRIEVYALILGQLQDMEFEEQDDINGKDVEHSYLRRMYRILNMPTGDLSHFKDKYSREKQLEKERRAMMQSWWKRVKGHCRKLLGDGPVDDAAGGFKSIQKKSLHFQNSRFREHLMDMAMLCRENAISNFVDNLDDIQILFIGMSPAIVRLFEHAFKQTRFTEDIKNADWRIGDTREVIGQQSSVVMEKDANRMIQKR